MFKIEKLKLQKKGLGIISFIFIGLSLLIGTALYYMNQEIFIYDDTQWLAIWGQSGMYFMQILFPILIGIAVGISCKVEHDHKNWQRMSSMAISYKKMIRSKLTVLGFYSGVCQFVFLILFYIIGLFFLGLPFYISDMIMFIFWSFCGWIGSLSICSFQLYIALKIKSFSASVSVAVGGALLGFILMIVIPPLATFFPYLQITEGSRTREFTSFSGGGFLIFIVFNIIISYVFYQLSYKYLEKREFY